MIMAQSLIAAAAAGMLAFVSPARAETVSLTMASSMTSAHTSTRAMEVFKDEVARRTRGSVQIELAPGEQLGSPAELVQKVRAESVFAAWVGASFFAQLVPEIEAVNLPFVFKDYGDLMRTIDGPVGRLIESKVDAKGFVLLAWFEFGARHVANAKRPLRTVDDFKGLKLWVSPAETFQATFRALGATPLKLPTREINDALRQGDIDGVEVPYTIIAGYKYYENLKYVSDSNHVLDLTILAANKRSFSRLTPEQQKIIREEAKLAALRQRKMSEDAEAAALESLKAAGLQFDPVPPETRAAMRKATGSVISRLNASIGPELLDKVITEAGGRPGNSAGPGKM
jgi:tripartite ATP-independent transporter DctP family solute receptor